MNKNIVIDSTNGPGERITCPVAAQPQQPRRERGYREYKPATHPVFDGFRLDSEPRRQTVQHWSADERRADVAEAHRIRVVA